MLADNNLDVVRQFVAEETSKEVTPNTKLSELDLDSLDFIDLLHQSELKFKCRIPDASVASMETVRDLAKVIFADHTN